MIDGFPMNAPKAYRALANSIATSGMAPVDLADAAGTEDRDKLLYYRYFTLAKEFGAAGAPTYVLSHSIAAALTATRSPIIPFARCPYPAFFIEVPSEFLPLPDHPNKGPDRPKHWISVVTTSNLRAISLHAQGIRSVAYIQALNDLSPIGEDELSKAAFGAISGTDPAQVRAISFEMRLAVRLASNVVAYVTAYQQNVTKRYQRNPGDVRLLDVAAPRDVVVDREFRTHVSALVAARTIPRARGVLAHLVRGHWRSLSGKEDLIWIAPYNRGDLNIGRVVERTDRL